MIETMFHAKPKVYGFSYLLLIPIFGLIYYLLPSTVGKELTLIEGIYFSTVTITTLGYGDISPTNDLGRVVAATESVLGITLIGLFLNALSRVRGEVAREEEIEKEKASYRMGEIAKLNGFYNLIRPLAESYKQSVKQITLPITNREKEYDPDFSFNDMKDLFKPALLITRNHQEPAVQHYFRDLENLNSEIVSMIKLVDLRLFPQLQASCHKFAECVRSADISGSILGMVNDKNGDIAMTDFISGMIESHTGPVKLKPANVINSYITLYYQIKILMNTLESIDNEITGITNN